MNTVIDMDAHIMDYLYRYLNKIIQLEIPQELKNLEMQYRGTVHTHIVLDLSILGVYLDSEDDRPPIILDSGDEEEPMPGSTSAAVDE